MYVFKDTGLQWLQERGYEWVKVNCEPGDLVLCKSHCPLIPVSKDRTYLGLASRRGFSNSSLQRLAEGRELPIRCLYVLCSGVNGDSGGATTEEVVVREHQGPQPLAASSATVQGRICYTDAKWRTLPSQPLEATQGTSVEREGIQVDRYPLYQSICMNWTVSQERFLADHTRVYLILYQ